MTKRQQAVSAAKEAYRLFITRGIKQEGFSVTDDEQHPYRMVWPIGGHGFVVFLKANGSLSWAYAATEREDYLER
jgi:hypothetical protein